MHGRLLPLLPTPGWLLCLWQSLHDPHSPLVMQYDCLVIPFRYNFRGEAMTAISIQVFRRYLAPLRLIFGLSVHAEGTSWTCLQLPEAVHLRLDRYGQWRAMTLFSAPCFVHSQKQLGGVLFCP